MTQKVKFVKHKDYMLKHLADMDEAVAFLKSCAEDCDLRFFRKALRQVAQAHKII